MITILAAAAFVASLYALAAWLLTRERPAPPALDAGRPDMTCLAAVNTDLGRIELHHNGQTFTTRRTYSSVTDGVELVITILHSRKSAEEWYELAERQGAVYAPFPEAETP
jgi:hypothetical protein